MLISIVIPTFNREQYLSQAIDSALSQDFSDLEILVLDNASTDGTAQLMRKYSDHPQIRYVRNEHNLGMVGSWRRALYELMLGEWFIILSDDDYLIDNSYVRSAAALLNQEPNLKLIYADGYILHEGEGKLIPLNLPFAGATNGLDVFASRGQISPQDFTLCNVIFNRSLAIELQAFSNPDNLSCDTELFLLSCLEGNVGVLKVAASVYRVHPSNLLKTTNGNPRLAMGSQWSLIKPYERAKQIGADEAAEAMRCSSRLDRELVRTLFKVACLDYTIYREAATAIALEAPTLKRDIIDRRMYKIGITICRLLPWLYPAYTMLTRRRNRFNA